MMSPPTNFGRLDDLVGVFERNEFDTSMNADVLELIKNEIRNRDTISGRLYKTEQSLNQYRTMFEESPLGIAIVSHDNKFVLVNPSLCTLLGYPEAELLGITFDTINFAQDRVVDQHLSRRLWAGDLRSYTIEKRFGCRDGHVIFARLMACSLRPAPGQHRRELIVLEKLEDCGLNGARQVGETGSADVAIASADAGTWDWGRQNSLMNWSPFLDSVLGYPAGELQRNWPSFRQLIHAEDARNVTDALMAHADGKTPQFEAQFRIRHNDGSYRWIILRGKGVNDDQGKIDRVNGLVLRVAQPKSAEQADIKPRAVPSFAIQPAAGQTSFLKCTRCNSTEVATSRSRWWDFLSGGLTGSPFRCRRCGKRFFKAIAKNSQMVDVSTGA